MSDFRRRIAELDALQKTQLAKALQNKNTLSAKGFATSQLVAYYVCQDDQFVDADEIKALLERRLPRHMVPSIMTQLEQLPKLPNGKINRKALPKLEAKRSSSEEKTEQSPPTSELQNQLAAIWGDVLGSGVVHGDDDFFELGGDSLLVIQIVSRVRELGFEIVPDDIFEKRTIANLIRKFETNDHRENAEQVDTTSKVENTSDTNESDAEPVATIASESESVAAESNEPRATESVPRTKQVQLVSIQAQGTKPPIYLIHTMGEGFQYAKLLAKHLGPDQPVYGITTMVFGRRLEDGDITPYADQLLKHNPNGPYLLAGVYCGGREAIKLCSYLQSMGKEIQWVGMIASMADLTSFKKLNLIQRLVAHGLNLTSYGMGYVHDRLNKRRIFGELTDQVLAEYFDFRYEQDRFEGSATIFRPKALNRFVDLDFGWNQFIEEPEFIDISSTASGLFSGKPLLELCTAVQKAIAKSEQRIHLSDNSPSEAI